MLRIFTILALALTLSATALNAQTNPNTAMTATAPRADVKVLMHTTMGDITILLYGDTPSILTTS